MTRDPYEGTLAAALEPLRRDVDKLRQALVQAAGDSWAWRWLLRRFGIQP